METNATIKLHAVDTNVVTTISNISTSVTNLQISSAALSGGFKILENTTKTNVAQMSLGAKSADFLTSSFGKLSVAGNRVTTTIGKIGTSIYTLQQLAVAADGVGRAAQQYARLPQAMQAMQASGVSTYTIEQFNTLTEAIRGSDIALDSLLISSIAELGEFEQAAARAGTILKSSFRFDESGNALTANAEERLNNAIAAQKLVNDRLNNSVTSSEALRGQYEVLSSGFTTVKESQEVLEQGLKLVSIGKAGGSAVNTTQTLQLLTKTLNAYELQASDAGRVSAVLNATVENGLTTIQELSNGFGATSSQASKAKIALEDVATSVSVLTSQGVNTAEALTGIGRISANIISKTPEAEKELAKLQLRGEKIRFDKAEIQAKGFTQALIDLYNAAGGSAEILAKIFPEDVAYRTANALLVEQGKRLASTRVAIASADETKLNQIVEVAQSDRVARFQRLANRFKESIIEIGIALAPTLEPGIQALETIANKFASLPEPVRKAIGSYLAFQIQSKAVSNAGKVLINTLITLAANYLAVRLISLALTGQLGKEAKAIKSLITQKKGLAAATLQLFGIDQKWRLEQEAATAAIAKQGAVAKAASAVKAKAAQTVKQGATKAIAVTSGIDQQQVRQALALRKQQALDLFRSARQKTSTFVEEKATKFGFQIPAPIKPKPEPPVKTVTTPTVKPTVKQPPVAEKPFSFVGLKPTVKPEAPPPVKPVIVPGAKPIVQKIPQAEKPLAPTVTKPTPVVKESPELDKFVASDATVAKKRAEYLTESEEYEKLISSKNKADKARLKAIKQRDKAEQKLSKARQSAISGTGDKTKALNIVEKRKQDLLKTNLVLQEKDLKVKQLNLSTLIQQNKLSSAQIALAQSETVAKVKYRNLARSIAQTEKANLLELKLSKAAKIARLKAEEAEILLGEKNKITLLAKRQAYLAETRAKKASKLATESKLLTEKISLKLTEAQNLAEQGLYKTRLFGRKVILSEVGLIGKLNKLMSANLIQINLAKTAQLGLAKAKSTLVAISDVRNLQIALEQTKLAALNVKSGATSVFSFISGGAKKAGSAVGGLLAPLGTLAPILGIATVAAIALRSELFGLGRDANNYAKEYKKFLKEQEKLNVSVEKRTKLTLFEGKLETGLSDTDINQELEGLRKAGAITTSEFNRLNTAFNSTSESSKTAQQSLRDLQNEIKLVKAGASEIDQGVIDSLFGSIKKIPSAIGGAFDFVTEYTAAGFNSLAQLQLVSRQEISINREADKLIKPLSILNNIQGIAGDRYIDTTIAINEYKESLSLTSEVQEKVSQGIKLTTADINNEQAAYRARSERNKIVIDELERQINDSKELADKTRNAENRRILENQIQSTIRQKEALEAQNEALKQLQEDTIKYLTETLPSIRTALKETSDPALALSNAQEKFNQTFLVDAEGNATKLLKPIEVLRTEAGKLVGQIQENLSLGLFDGFLSAELEVADRIRSIRDDEISFIEDGVEKKGYRLQLSDRKELTKQIVQLENIELERENQNNKLKIDLQKSLAQNRLDIAANTNLEIAILQQKEIENRIAQKENEIEELKAIGIRTIEQEIQLQQLLQARRFANLGVQRSTLDQQSSRERLLNQERENANKALIVSLSSRINYLSQENSLAQQSLVTYDNQQKAISQITNLQKDISQNQTFNLGVEKQLAKAKIINLKQSLPIEKQIFQNQLAISKQKNQQNLIQAEINLRNVEQAEIEAQRDLRFAIENNASKEQVRNLQLALEQSRLNLIQADQSYQQSLLQSNLETQISEEKRQQFEINKAIESSIAQINLSRANLAETEARITENYKLQTTEINSRLQRSQVDLDSQRSVANFRTGELNLAAKVADKEKDKQLIAKQTAALKLRSLESQIASEAKILALKQNQAKLDLRADADKNIAALSQNRADILKAQADLQELQATGASEASLKAQQAQIQAAEAQRQVLANQNLEIAKREKLLIASQKFEREDFERRSNLKIDTARVEAVDVLPEKQQERARARLFREFRRDANIGTTSPNLLSLIDKLSKANFNVPKLQIPEISLPSLDDIRGDLTKLVSNTSNNKGKDNNQLTTIDKATGKQIIIKTLNLENPININIDGSTNDTEELIQQIEGRIFNAAGESLSFIKEKINNNIS